MQLCLILANVAEVVFWLHLYYHLLSIFWLEYESHQNLGAGFL